MARHVRAGIARFESAVPRARAGLLAISLVAAPRRCLAKRCATRFRYRCRRARGRL